MGKKKIGIWFGGRSTEYQVSLQSAEAVLQALNREKYEPVMIGIDREGRWYLYQGPVEQIAQDTWCREEYCVPVTIDMGSCQPGKDVQDKWHGQAIPDRRHGLLIRHGDTQEHIFLDAAFPVLHGKNGEDGTLQGLLELCGIPLIGCNTLSGAVCMEKDMAHRLAQQAGIEVPVSWRFAEGSVSWEQIAGRARELGYPLFVKPVRAGSSFGITKVTAPEKLKEAVELAFAHDSFCIMEEAVEGFEVGCAVLGHPWEELTVGEIDEIELSEGFFDYTEKYTLKTSAIHVPARISAEKAQEIKEAAKTVYRALGCDFFARVDLFLTPEGRIYFNEVNTIPGFTSHSRYPGMMRAAGICFEELLERLLALQA